MHDPSQPDPNSDATATTPPADAADAAGGGADPAAATAGTNDPPAKSEDEQLAELVDKAIADNPADPTAAPAAGTTATDAASDPAAGDDPAKAAGAQPGKDGQPPEDDPTKAVEVEAQAVAEKLGIKNEAANAKFKELYATAKRVPELEEGSRRYQQHIEHIERTGATPEQYQRALSLIQVINTGGPEQWSQARAALLAEVAQLDERLGRGKPGDDPLAAHADLQAAVKAGDLTASFAAEIAASRGKEKAQDAWTRQQQEQQQQLTQEDRELVQARDQLNDLETRLKATDKEYERKRALLVPMLAPIMAGLPAAARLAAFLNAYSQLKLPPEQKPITPSHQPLRATGGASNLQPVPTTEMEALEEGLRRASTSTY